MTRSLRNSSFLLTAWVLAGCYQHHTADEELIVPGEKIAANPDEANVETPPPGGETGDGDDAEAPLAGLCDELDTPLSQSLCAAADGGGFESAEGGLEALLSILGALTESESGADAGPSLRAILELLGALAGSDGLTGSSSNSGDTGGSGNLAPLGPGILPVPTAEQCESPETPLIEWICDNFPIADDTP